MDPYAEDSRRTTPDTEMIAWSRRELSHSCKRWLWYKGLCSIGTDQLALTMTPFRLEHELHDQESEA